MVRPRHYPSDTTDQEWALIEPLLPPKKKDGRPEKHDRRDIFDALMYLNKTGCPWRYLPVDFPPWRTVYAFFDRMEEAGAVEAINAQLRRDLRVALGRAPEPTAAVIDSQSVKGAPTVTRDTRGYDGGKKVNGRKRFIAVDVTGALLCAMVVPAGVQDRDGAKPLLTDLHQLVPTVRHAFADSAFSGKLVDWVAEKANITLEIVRRKDRQDGFVPLPKRWVVERSLAWISAHRRLARDYERRPERATTFIHMAMIGTALRRLARGKAVQRWGPPITEC